MNHPAVLEAVPGGKPPDRPRAARAALSASSPKSAASSPSLPPPPQAGNVVQPPFFPVTGGLAGVISLFATHRVPKARHMGSRLSQIARFHRHNLQHPPRPPAVLRSTPDCRPRRAFLHLSYSYASPCGPALLVTQDPQETSSNRVYSIIQFVRASSEGGM